MFTYDSEQEVKSAANLLEIVEEFVSLQPKGSSFIAPCPLHDEKTPSFYVTPSKGIYKCFGCGKGGDAINFLQEKLQTTYPQALQYVADKYNIKLVKEGDQNYVIPVWKNNTQLSDKVVEWFGKRKISPKTLIKTKITEGVESMPTDAGWVDMNTMQFNYFRDGVLINTKYRGKNKTFKLVSGAELIFYGLDTLKGKKEAIIVEGECDQLALMEAGMDENYAILSVPNGASKHRNNLAYLNNCIKDFDSIETIHLGLDSDANGRKLREELADRFGKHRCRRSPTCW
jgi:DNA primase